MTAETPTDPKRDPAYVASLDKAMKGVDKWWHNQDTEPKTQSPAAPQQTER